MHLESRALREPEPDLLLFVGCIFVDDDMNIKVGGHAGVDVA